MARTEDMGTNPDKRSFFTAWQPRQLGFLLIAAAQIQRNLRAWARGL
jgi:hypothetical protein